MPNEKVDVVRGDRVVLLQIVKGKRGESCREVPTEDVDRGARVLRGAHNMHYWSVKGKGWRDINLN